MYHEKTDSGFHFLLLYKWLAIGTDAGQVFRCCRCACGLMLVMIISTSLVCLCICSCLSVCACRAHGLFFLARKILLPLLPILDYRLSSTQSFRMQER